MESRRRNGLIALVVLVTALAAVLYYQWPRPGPEPTTAFAPAQSADESVPPSDTPIEPPAEIAGAPAEAEAIEETAEAGAAPESGPAGQAAEVAAAASEEGQQTQPAEIAAVPGDEAGPPETDVALAEPGADVPAAAAEPEVLPDSAVPTFDIVRVEPSGETVIAGQSEPHATIEILDGTAVIATAEANEGGDWAIALDAPLEPGTHDLAIQTTSPDESVVLLSDERVTVSVPEEGTEVLVVLNAPGAASTVLQVPAGAEVIAAAEPQAAAGVEQDVALAEADSPVGAPPPQEDVVAETPADEPAAGEQEVASAPAEADSPLAAPPPQADAVTEAPAAEAAMGEQVASAPAEADSPLAAPPPSDDIAAQAPASEPAGEQQIASAPAEADSPVGAPPPEDGSAAVASSADEPVAGEQEIASAPVEADSPLAAPPQDDVAEVPPVDEPSPGSQQASEPAGDNVAEPAPETEVAVAPAVEEPPAPPPPPEPLVVVAAVEADTDGTLYVAGTATTGETVRVYLDDALIGDAVPSPTGTWLVETVKDLPAGEYVVRADQVADDGTVIARSEVPFDREVEVAILRPSGTTASSEGAAVAGAMPAVDTVIIKKGDNLWRIARATWGRGIRWSTIYEANTDQIRNPNRIYPGQVFVMPKGDAAWQN